MMTGRWNQVRRRLHAIYAISKQLVSFVGVETSLPALLEIMNATVSVATVILIEGREGRLRMLVWHGATAAPEMLLRAEANARVSYSFLTGPLPAESSNMVVIRTPLAFGSIPPIQPRGEALNGRKNFITLPLAIGRGAIFGAFQVEGAKRLDEDDLLFVDSVAQQLAVAIDRQHALRREATLRMRAEILRGA